MDNVVNSKVWRLSVGDNGMTWKYIGGINSGAIKIDSPVADTTSQSTNPDGTIKYTSSGHTGYKTVTINGSGLVDTTTSAAIEAYGEFLDAYINDGKEMRHFKIENSVGTYTGQFNISSFEETASETDKLKFSMSAQNAGVVTYTPEV